jgi:hypothetical protein
MANKKFKISKSEISALVNKVADPKAKEIIADYLLKSSQNYALNDAIENLALAAGIGAGKGALAGSFAGPGGTLAGTLGGAAISALNQAGKDAKQIVRGLKTQANNIREAGQDLMQYYRNHASWYGKEMQISANANYSVPRGVISGNSKISLISNGGCLLMHLSVPYNTRIQNVSNDISTVYFESNIWDDKMSHIYNTIRWINSGAINYSVIQLSDYLHNVRGVIATYHTCKRIIEALNTYETYNKESALVVPWFAGIRPKDYDKWSEIRSALYDRLMICRNRIKDVLAVPSDLDLFKRDAYLFSWIGKQSNDPKSEFYSYKLATLSYIDHDTPTNGKFYELIKDAEGPAMEYSRGFYVPENTVMGGVDLISPFDALEDMLDRFVANRFTGVIVGDIIKAYGNASLVLLPEFNINNKVTFICNSEALDQFINTQTFKKYTAIVSQPFQGFLVPYTMEDSWTDINEDINAHTTLDVRFNSSKAKNTMAESLALSMNASGIIAAKYMTLLLGLMPLSCRGYVATNFVSMILNTQSYDSDPSTRMMTYTLWDFKQEDPVDLSFIVNIQLFGALSTAEVTPMLRIFLNPQNGIESPFASDNYLYSYVLDNYAEILNSYLYIYSNQAVKSMLTTSNRNYRVMHNNR